MSKRLLFYMLIFVKCTLIYAQTDINQIRSMLWVQETIQTDIENIIKPVLLNGFTDKERLMSRNIEIVVVADKRIGRVRAIEENGVKKIEISTGFIALMANLIEADILSTNFGYIEKLSGYYLLISDYLKQYNSSLANGIILPEPEPFFKFIDMNQQTYIEFIQTEKYDFLFSANMRILLGYIISHEYAHHIFGHLNINKANNLSESRKNEDEADDFSIRVNWMLNNNPLIVARYFMLFTAVEEIPHNYTHTASACRLEKFLHAGIKFTEPSIKTNAERAYIDQLEFGRQMLIELCEDGDFMPFTSIPGLW